MAATTKKLYREYNDNGVLIRKECRKCSSIKPIDQFYVKGSISQTNIDGYQNHCIECHKAKWRERAKDPNARVRWLLERIRAKCKKEKIAFDLTLDDIVVPTHCPVLGRPLKFGMPRSASYERRGKAPPTDDSPSVDRIDPTKGYTKGNIVVVSWRANRIKGNATYEELCMIVDFYQQYEKGRKK